MSEQLFDVVQLYPEKAHHSTITIPHICARRVACRDAKYSGVGWFNRNVEQNSA